MQARQGVARDWKAAVLALRVAVIVAAIGGLAESTEAAVDRVASRTIQIGIEQSTGQLVELTDRASRHNLVAAPLTNSSGIWELEFTQPEAGRLFPANASSFKTSSLSTRSARQFTWSGFNLAAAPKLSVVVTARLESERALSRWNIQVRDLGALTLKTVRFPRVLNISEQAHETLAVPIWTGQQAANPRKLLRDGLNAPKRMEWHYPGILSMQCVALANDTGGALYVACDDTEAFGKDFAVFATTNAAMNLEICHRPERTVGPQTEYTLPYSVVLGTFRGDWFSAAQIYRAWATNQSWARESRLARGISPAWVTNTALWVWNRGQSSGVIDPAIALQARLGLPVSIFWHWWHGCAYDTGFPEYLPPREGDTSFMAAMQRAHEHDVRGIVYMNQRLWGMTTASWTNENAERFAVKGEDAKVHPEVYNTFTKLPCASMCMGTEFWRDKYAGLATEAFQRLGVDGIYMDQACSSLACFDSRHGHAIGGGTYWMRGFQSLAADIRRRCDARGGPVLAGEGCGENWLPHLDLMLALQVSRERYASADGWETIPFFHAVYHDYAVFFGNYSSLTAPPYDELWPAEFAPREPLKLLDRKFSNQFRLEQARAFVWGQQSTMANLQASHLTERAEEVDYALRLATIRSRGLKYLLRGEFLPPPKVAAPSADLPMSRLSIYAGQQGGVKEFRSTTPLVLATAWRAPDRSVALAVASISDRTLTPKLEIDATACKLTGRGSVFRIDAGQRRKIGEFRGRKIILQPELAPFDACLLELKPN